MSEIENLAEVIAQSIRNLEVLAASYRDAVNETSAARSREVTALNALNQEQKAFDELVSLARKSSPSGSDWSDPKRGRPA